jgi:hypothetical protein
MGIALSLGMKNHSDPPSDLQAEPMNVGSALLCAIATLMPFIKAWVQSWVQCYLPLVFCTYLHF